jgi:tetratricopeptide (TPR) repeat protein
MDNPVDETAETVRLARRAVELGKNDPTALFLGGWGLAMVGGDLDTGAALIDRALVLNPNLAAAWHCGGWVRVFRGEPEEAINYSARAMRLSPFDPLSSQPRAATATAHLLADRYEQAWSWAEESLQEQPNYPTGLRVLAASYALGGRLDEAQRTIARLRQVDPTLRVSTLQDRVPLRRSEDVAKFAEGLRLAGLPE